MFPSSFDESNAALSRPLEMTDEQCDPLSVWRGPVFMNGEEEPMPAVVSCWKCTKEELEEINRTGRVWLLVYGGSMPPACVTGLSPFPRS